MKRQRSPSPTDRAAKTTVETKREVKRLAVDSDDDKDHMRLLNAPRCKGGCVELISTDGLKCRACGTAPMAPRVLSRLVAEEWRPNKPFDVTEFAQKASLG